MTRKLSTEAQDVLACLPKEPLACPIPEIAADVFGHSDSQAISQTKHALSELIDLTFVESVSTRAPRIRHFYGIRADRWKEAHRLLTQTPV